MTKAITGAACMQLVEQGKRQLDQPMSFDINIEAGPAGRSVVANLRRAVQHLLPARSEQARDLDMTQFLPFADDQALKLLAKFERGLYAATS